MVNIFKSFILNLIFLSFLLSLKATAVIEKYEQTECPQSAFIGCIIQLKLSGVIFDRNIANIIYSIDNETKLLKTCKAYTNILPCFREKIIQCGSHRQRRMLNEVGKTIEFLCSPYSLANQRILLSKGKCINHVINKPISNKCEIKEPKLYASLSSCAKNCEKQKGNVFCHMRTWISTQNLCTTLEIYKNCGSDAASFYSDFQSVAFEPTFPIVCQASIESIAEVKNFFKSSNKQSNNNKVNKVIPFLIQNKHLASNTVKETVPLKNYNDQNIVNVFPKIFKENFIDNNNHLKQAEEILEKIFPDMITKSYANIFTTTSIPITTKQPQLLHFNERQIVPSNIGFTTPNPNDIINHRKEKQKILLTTPYNDKEKTNNNKYRKNTVTFNEIELLASIMSSLPVNNTLLMHQSLNNNDVVSIQPQTTTLKYNNNEENLLTFLNNQNDDNENNLLSEDVIGDVESIEKNFSNEENVEDYVSTVDYQTSTTTMVTSPMPTTKIKINIPKDEVTIKSVVKKVDGKKIPWYLRGMKKHVFVNTNDGFKKFSQR